MNLPKMQSRPTLPNPAHWSFPSIDEDTVDGVRVAACHLPGHPLVAVQVHADLPITADPAGQEGLTVLMAKCLQEGTKRLDARTFASQIEALGARFTTNAGHGGLRANVSAPANRIPAAFELLTEALAEPRLRDEDLNRLRGQRLDEIASEEADPERRAWMVQRPRLWDPADRRSVAAAGSRDSVESLDPAGARKLHARLRRGGTTLVAVGDLSTIDVPGLAAVLSAALPPDDRPREPAATPLPGSGGGAVVFHRPESVQTALEIGRAGPGRQTPDWPALMVAMHVLGGTLTSRLDAVLREEKGYTYGVRARRSPMRGASVLTHLSGSVQSEVTEEAMDDAWRIMGEFVADGPTDEEVEDAVAWLAGVQPLRHETPRAVAGAISSCIANDLPLGHVGTEIAALHEVTTAAVAAAARQHLRLDDVVIVAVADRDHVGSALEGRVGDVETLEG